MSAYRCAMFVCTGVFVASAVSTSDIDFRSREPRATMVETSASEGTSLESTSSATAAMTAAVSRGPILHPRLSETITTRLNEAIPVALEHLRDYPSCQALFARLGADGVVKLNNTSYYPAGARQESKYCRGGSLAITTVGGSAVVLCRSFARLSAQEAAIILLHEALHFAGQTEYPSDPDAPDDIGISEMVMKSCRLSMRRVHRYGVRALSGG